MKYYTVEWKIGGEDLFGPPFDEYGFSSLKTAVDRIETMSNEMDYITLLENNFSLFSSNAQNAELQQQNHFRKINCSFTNFFASFYLWKSYHCHKYGNLFRSLQQQYRDQNIIYRIGEELRNCSAHQAFTITKHTYDVRNETSHYLINPQILLTNPTKLNAQLKRWLNIQKENNAPIDAFPFVCDFYQLCANLQKDFWANCIERIHKDLSTIYSYLPEGVTNIYNTNAHSEDQSVFASIGPVVSLFLKKASLQYPGFVPTDYLGKF